MLTSAGTEQNLNQIAERRVTGESNYRVSAPITEKYLQNRKRQRSEVVMAPAPHKIIEGTALLPEKRHWRIRATTAKKRDIQAKSMLPKTAINFYNHKKGLYLKNSSRFRNVGLVGEPQKVIGSQERTISKSVNLLNAYGELA